MPALKWSRSEVLVLEDEHLKAWLSPALGNNLFRLWDKVAGRDVLRSPTSEEAFARTPGAYGIPILFPPGRVRHGTFEFRGRVYRLPSNARGGHHLHGSLRELPWEVASAEPTRIVSKLSTTDVPGIFGSIRHRVTFSVAYELREGSLVQRIEAINGGDSPAPFGLGLHTWFSLDAAPADWTLHLNASHAWALDREAIPTGTTYPLGPVGLGDLRRSQGLSLQNADLNAVLTAVEGTAEAVLMSPGAGLCIRYAASEAFRHWIVYTGGPATNFVCVEPCTSVPNAPNLSAGPRATGFRAIEPGETLRLSTSIGVAAERTPPAGATGGR